MDKAAVGWDAPSRPDLPLYNSEQVIELLGICLRAGI